jgi:glucose-1-phosphate thymidylyltransferase
MKIIVPMAGRGSRLRPHTLTTPKPLIPVGGIPIVHRLVADIAEVCNEKITDIGFVIGDFGTEVEDELIQVAAKLGAKGHIFHQLEPLGTAHAVLCAEPLLTGKVVVAFADTLFKANFTLSDNDEGVLWVKQIEDPSAFGVIKMNEAGHIVDFVEKPQTFVSDLAMIGIYYFKNAEALHYELQYLIDNNVCKGGEFQLPDALRNLTEKGTRFVPGEVSEWLDCGNKAVTVETNQRVLEFDAKKGKDNVAKNVELVNSVIIQPCFIGSGTKIVNSVVGPHVSLGAGCSVVDSRIENALIQNKTSIKNAVLNNAMVGSHCKIELSLRDYSIGDYSTLSN